MNAEQIVKALECCCSSETGCYGCPYEDESYSCDVTKDSLAFIKEQQAKIEKLTEENERLRAENKKLFDEAGNQSTLWKQHFESLYETAKETVKADTVKKMRERAAEIVGELVELVFDDNMPNCIVPSCLKPDSIGCGHRICIEENKAIWLGKIDQIAKEMLEGNHEVRE